MGSGRVPRFRFLRFVQTVFDPPVTWLATMICHSVLPALLLLLSLLDHHGQLGAQEVGLDRRVPWTTSNFSGTPEPSLPYLTKRAFPELQFDRCIDLAQPQGSDRLYVAQQNGKIVSFPNDQDVSRFDLAVDLRKEIKGLTDLYAITFHPKFKHNRFIYVCYILKNPDPQGTHIARFKVNDTNPPTIDVSSEKTILTFLSGGHNGCCLKFGPDGFLYISTGDGSGPNPPDRLKAGQDVSNLQSAILRIDVDQSEGKRNYRIPPDNPFVGRENAREEIWAYGLRNPWRMSFDEKTGDLWVGDVGWELWELMNRVVKGGNYGWSVMEGNQPTNPGWERGPTPILPPTIEHSHDESSSITDGLTYYGSRLPGLQGHHVYSDYDTGKFWSFRYVEGQVKDLREIADSDLRVVGFGVANDGEFYILDHIGGTLHQLVKNPDAGKVNSRFPRKLSESGLFASTADYQFSPGVFGYSVNAEMWADHAIAARFIAVPGSETIKASGNQWVFPDGTVLGKTLAIERLDAEDRIDLPERGNKDLRTLTRIETQIMHLDSGQWRTYSYRWNEQETDAELVKAEGAAVRLSFRVDLSQEAGLSNAGKSLAEPREQIWRFASRSDCQRCHNRWSGPVLGFTTQQLDKQHRYSNNQASQLKTLEHIGLIEKKKARPRFKLVDPHDPSQPLELRARSYLDVNCAHCHRMHAGGAVLAKMHVDLALDKTNMVGELPSQGTFQLHAARVIAPGEPLRSVLYYRMAKIGGGRMPRLGSSEVDVRGLNLMDDWISSLPRSAEKDKTGVFTAAKIRSEELLLMSFLKKESDLAKCSNLIKQILVRTSGALRLVRAIDRRQLTGEKRKRVVKLGAEHAEVTIRDLFERYLSLDQRTKRLGNEVDLDQILQLPGDAERGHDLFFKQGTVQCVNCHQIGKEGKVLGPDLSKIGAKYNKRQLLESILWPSRFIEPVFTVYAVETVDGQVLSGLLESRNKNRLVLVDAQGKRLKIPMIDVEQFRPMRQSLMPDLLLRDMTPQQAADLIDYLSTLK